MTIGPGERLCFVPLTQAEYEAYMAVMVPAYTREVAKAASMSLEAATARTRQQLAGILPEGRMTPEHDFLAILDDRGRRAGTLWVGPRREDATPTFYIYDIVVDRDRRGEGIGTAALLWVESEAARRGLDAISLSVVAHNQGAIRLYERMGYEALVVEPAGQSMIKRLARSGGEA